MTVKRNSLMRPAARGRSASVAERRYRRGSARVKHPVSGPGSHRRTASGAPPASNAARSAGSRSVAVGRWPMGRRTGLFLALFLSITGLVMLGVVMGLSTTAAPSLAGTDSAWALFKRHLIWILLGSTALIAMIRIDYHLWRSLASTGLVVVLGLLVATLLPTVGVTMNGARRWIGVGPLTLQVSEMAKLALVLFVAELLSRDGRMIEDNRATLRPVMAVTVVLVGLHMLQPHLGASIMVAAIVMVMLWFAGTRLLSMLSIGCLGLGGAMAMVAFSPWRRARIIGFLDPWEDPLGKGYQPLQSLHALASGGITGVGIGESRSKWGFLPYAHTDFVFAVIGEELGLIGTLFVITLFGIIGIAGFCVAMRAPDRFGMLLAVGLTTWILLQAVINVGAVLAIFPVVGLTLPFLSFGGSSLVMTMVAVGLLLNIARQTR